MSSAARCVTTRPATWSDRLTTNCSRACFEASSAICSRRDRWGSRPSWCGPPPGCARGGHVVVLDLTAIGQNLTPEQWYDGLMLISALSLKSAGTESGLFLVAVTVEP